MIAATAERYPGPQLVRQSTKYKAGTVTTGADIQIEEGNWAKIHNDILTALTATRLTGMEWSALMFLFRQTYGWQKKEDTISYSQFAEAMGVKRHHAMVALQKLEERNIIYSRDNGPNRAKTYGFNKYHETWDSDSMRQTVTPQRNSLDEPGDKTSPPQGNRSVTSQGNRSVTPQGNNKRYKDKERGEEDMPPPSTSCDDPCLNAAKNNFNRRQDGKPIYNRQMETAEWNAQLPACERTPLAEAIADITGKRLLWEAGDDDRLHAELHQAAITTHKMGYTSVSVRTVSDRWKADWRGRDGGSVGQFLAFLSEQGAIVAKKKRSVVRPVGGDM